MQSYVLINLSTINVGHPPGNVIVNNPVLIPDAGKTITMIVVDGE